jgi:hypothetical protein
MVNETIVETGEHAHEFIVVKRRERRVPLESNLGMVLGNAAKDVSLMDELAFAAWASGCVRSGQMVWRR